MEFSFQSIGCLNFSIPPVKTDCSIGGLAVVVGLGLFALSPLAANPGIDAASANESSTSNSVPEELTPTEWAGIREAHEAWKHRFTEGEDGTFSASNPGQQWRTVFDGRGFTTEPRGGVWRWGLELTGYGIGGNRRPVGSMAKAEATGTRLSYHWDGTLEEWFLNDGRGLEQGWTLSERPDGTGVDEEILRLDLAVRGDLRPIVGTGGRSVNFVSEDGTTALTYGGLKAWDATGRPLAARFIPRAGGIAVTVDERGATYPVTIDPIAQQAYLKASNAGGDDRFGISVAVSGDTVIVGAPREDSSTTGVNSVPDELADESGAAYVFIRTGGTWSQQAYLKASNAGDDDDFGFSVAISGDTVAVGATGESSSTTGVNSTPDESAGDSGAAYIFTRSGVTWSQQAYLKASNTGATDGFGVSVAVSGDTVVVGANGEDSSTTGVNSVPDESAVDSGAAYVFTRSGVTWSQQAYLKASNTGAGDFFGQSVAVSDDTVVVGAYLEDSSTTGVNSVPDESAGDSGAAYVFTRSGMTWSQQAYLKASNTGASDNLGYSVAVSDDTVVVGAFWENSSTTGVNSTPDESAGDSGAAYVFTRSGVAWSQQAYLKASNTGADDRFGGAVAVSGDTVVVGALREDSNTKGVNSVPNELANLSGAAYVFIRSGVIWSQQAYLKASNTGAGDFFGQSVAVSDDTVVVGARFEDSSTTGVNSVPDELAGNSGAAYVFTTVAPTSPSTSLPTLRVTGKKRINTSKRRVTLKGTAADADGDLVRVEARDSRPKGRKKFRSARGTASWRYKAPLKSGRNTVKIRAVDATGKKSRTTRVKIIKK